MFALAYKDLPVLINANKDKQAFNEILSSVVLVLRDASDGSRTA